MVVGRDKHGKDPLVTEDTGAISKDPLFLGKVDMVESNFRKNIKGGRIMSSDLSQKESFVNKENLPSMAPHANAKGFGAEMLGDKKIADSSKQKGQLFEFMAGTRQDKDEKVYSRYMVTFPNVKASARRFIS